MGNKKLVMVDTHLLQEARKLFPEISGLRNYSVVDWSLRKNISEAQTSE